MNAGENEILDFIYYLISIRFMSKLLRFEMFVFRVQ